MFAFVSEPCSETTASKRLARVIARKPIATYTNDVDFNERTSLLHTWEVVLNNRRPTRRRDFSNDRRNCVAKHWNERKKPSGELRNVSDNREKRESRKNEASLLMNR